MKILIINISLRPESKTIYLPLGIAYVASAIKNAGKAFFMLDIDAYKYSDTYIEKYMRDNQFDVVCMGCIVTGYKFIKQFASIIKTANPRTKIIVGNSVASSIPDILLTKTRTDICIMGEGDITVVEVLKTLEASGDLRDVEGICYKLNGRIIKNASRKMIGNIDTIPFPDWELFDMNKYIESCSMYGASDPLPMPREKLKAFTISTARGCPFQCTFCYQVFKGEKYRNISPVVLVRELMRMKEAYGINYFIFHDDFTLSSKKHAYDMAQQMLEADLNVSWAASCRSNLFTDDSDIELAKMLKKAGCVGLAFSLENSNPEILKMMHKKINPEDFSRQCAILNKIGLSCWTSLVFGYPIETKETIRQTIDFCIQNNIYPSVGFLLPQPATAMYEYAIKNGFIKDEEEYLLTLGDRQDLRLNMTAIPDDEFTNTVYEAMEKCNKKLQLNLEKDCLLKTTYYRGVERAV